MRGECLAVFMILSHLARFLSLLVRLEPGRGKGKKKCSVFSPSAFPHLSFLCCRYTKTPTHINICLHTKIFVCGCQPPPKSLPSAYKNKTAQPLCCTGCDLPSLSVRPFLTPAAALCFPGLNGPLSEEWVSTAAGKRRAAFRSGVGCSFIRSQTGSQWWMACYEKMIVDCK